MTPHKILSSCPVIGPALLLAAALGGCTHDIDMVDLGLRDNYYIARMTKLALSPAFTGDSYLWTLTAPDGSVRRSSTDPEFLFMESELGEWKVTYEIIDDENPYRFDCTITVSPESVPFSPWIAHVYEYRPAPGQFINEMPRYEEGDSEADMIRKCEESISGINDELISLGGWGGYVTFGFDHTVVNVPGEKDFRIWGNAFYELAGVTEQGGSAEPGIVMVSYDTNCNGLPDDPWYELRGSESDNPLTRSPYSMTWFRPDPGKTPVPGGGGLFTDMEYIRWKSTDGETGYLPKNLYHRQSYWPLWLDDSSLTFTGTLLPPNGTDASGNGSYYVLKSYAWGYVDNHPNDNAELNSFDISDAVDSEGNPVNLPGADFIRVYTGMNQVCGWLGESSTELSKARDLHIDTGETPLPDPGI